METESPHTEEYGITDASNSSSVRWNPNHRIHNSAWMLTIETLSPLLGLTPNPDLVKSIKDKVLKYEEVEGIHDLIVHD